MPIETISDLENAYRALRQVVEEHPDGEAMKLRFEDLYHELREQRAKAIAQKDSRIPMMDIDWL